MSADTPTRRLSRRHFLRVATIAGGSALLAACQQTPAPAAKPAESKPAESKPAAQPTAAAAKPTTAPAAAKPAESKPAANTSAASTPAAATSAPAAAKRSGTLNYAEAGDFNNFNPWSVTATNAGMYNQAFSRLLWKDGNGKENPDLAESWQMAPDGLSFRAKLRQGAKWQDGKDVTAQDFVTMFGYTKDETLIKDAAIKKHQGLISPIKDVKAPDASTVEFQFGSPVPYITDILDYWYAIRIDDPSDPSFTKKPPVSTGPFKTIEWQPNQFARFQQNPEFYFKDQPGVAELMFKRLEKAETLIPNLQSGGIDGIQVTSTADVAPLREVKDLAIEINESAGSTFDIVVNVGKPPFDKKEVRQALSYSLNRVEMAKSAFFGVSRPIVSAFPSPSSIAYREDLVMAYAFDLDKAAKMLEANGVKNLQMTTNVTPRWPQMKLFMLLWQADLAKIGIKLTVNEVETAKFYDIYADKDLQGNDLHPWLNARTTRDPAIFWSTQTNFRGNDRNPFGYRNAELEKLVADGAVELDPAKRKSIYQKLNEMVIDEANMIMVATDPRVWAFNKAVTGVGYDLSGNIMLGSAHVGR
ncbi:MAG: twin-arginine translocation signal domain-containing protein [Chloroflexi bacterium]|nr:twin-arginine translocation signal domain-containing protein [Chloroflexota bacterium]